ncbi:hypothetical protein Aperf_G00000120003 [Anoplocephala perfoliata]
MFPDNHVQETTEGIATAPATRAVSSVTAMALYDFEGCELLPDSINLLNMFMKFKFHFLKKAYSIAQSDELSFKAVDEIVDVAMFDTAWWSGRIGDRAGDEIADINKFDAQWWAGCIGNRWGIFPSNYVEEKSGAATSGSQVASAITATALYNCVAGNLAQRNCSNATGSNLSISRIV